MGHNPGPLSMSQTFFFFEKGLLTSLQTAGSCTPLLLRTSRRLRCQVSAWGEGTLHRHHRHPGLWGGLRIIPSPRCLPGLLFPGPQEGPAFPRTFRGSRFPLGAASPWSGPSPRAPLPPARPAARPPRPAPPAVPPKRPLLLLFPLAVPVRDANPTGWPPRRPSEASAAPSQPSSSQGFPGWDALFVRPCSDACRPVRCMLLRLGTIFAHCPLCPHCLVHGRHSTKMCRSEKRNRMRGKMELCQTRPWMASRALIY